MDLDSFDRGLIVFPIGGRWGLIGVTPGVTVDLSAVTASGLPHEMVEAYDDQYAAMNAAGTEIQDYVFRKPDAVVFLVTTNGDTASIRSWGPVTTDAVEAFLSSVSGLPEIGENLLPEVIRAVVPEPKPPSRVPRAPTTTIVGYTADESPPPEAPFVPTMTFIPDEPVEPLVVAVSPGTAPDEEIAEVLARLSHLYRQMGGSGITFELQGVAEVPDGEGVA